jgi:Tol biopolymer transport system component
MNFIVAAARRRRSFRTLSALTASIFAAVAFLIVAPLASATFTGENGRIVFGRTVGGKAVLFTVRPSGGGLLQLTKLPSGVNAFRADWSPNGHWLAYTRIGEEVETSIFRIRRDGTHRQNLSRGTCVPNTCTGELSPAWSPDAKRIAYVREAKQSGRGRIYVKDADGTHAEQVVPFRRRTMDSDPQWSPSGKRLVFVRFHLRKGKSAVFTTRLDRTELHRLTPWRMDAGLSPDWSPNGRWILFGNHATSFDAPSTVWLMRPNGDARHRITTSSGGTVTWFDGSFSPDGEQITITQAEWDGQPGAGEVYVLSKQGDILRNVTESPLSDYDPDWGPRPR